jgi:hypothetical protein
VAATNSKVSYERLLVVVEADKPDDQPTITATRCVVTVDLKESREKLQRILRQDHEHMSCREAL